MTSTGITVAKILLEGEGVLDSRLSTSESTFTQYYAIQWQLEITFLTSLGGPTIDLLRVMVCVILYK